MDYTLKKTRKLFLVLDEFKRRAAEGLVETTLAEESRYLSAWLTEAHPRAHPMKPGSVENAIRVEHKRWKKIQR